MKAGSQKHQDQIHRRSAGCAADGTPERTIFLHVFLIQKRGLIPVYALILRCSLLQSRQRWLYTKYHLS